MFCENCGAKILENSDVCLHCGVFVDKQNQLVNINKRCLELSSPYNKSINIVKGISYAYLFAIFVAFVLFFIEVYTIKIIVYNHTSLHLVSMGFCRASSAFLFAAIVLSVICICFSVKANRIKSSKSAIWLSFTELFCSLLLFVIMLAFSILIAFYPDLFLLFY